MLLQIQDLAVGYRGRAILPRMTFDVAPGELWAVIGPNGAGKSTFLRTMLGLQHPVAGTIAYGGGAIGYVPQRNEIDPAVPQRVIDLVRMGVERGWRVLDPLAARRNPAVQAAMEATDVMPLARTQWRRLSEGQKQRALLAQALAGEPSLLVLDEPTSAMDLHAEAGIFAVLEKLRTERHLGIVVISHHLALLAKYATHVLLLDKDEQLALLGDRETVLRHPAFMERYGQVLDRGVHHG
jgi:zinc transport system ATP-binding protein